MQSCEAKLTRACSRKTKNNTKFLFGQPLQLTTNQIGTKKWAL